MDVHHRQADRDAPFEGNEGSVRVLEKAGYVREARMRRSAIKDGKVLDQFLYAYVP